MFTWLALVAVAVEITGCSRKTKDADASSQQNVQTVGTFAASRHGFSRTIEFPATAEAQAESAPSGQQNYQGATANRRRKAMTTSRVK